MLRASSRRGSSLTLGITTPMWYEKLGINSIGAQCGGPVDGGLSDIKVEHWVAEQERSSEREPSFLPLLLDPENQRVSTQFTQ